MKKIFYFGYGAMVNPVSRARRGVETVSEKAAILTDYRLTFSEAGVANIKYERGWDVHGVLMECAAEKDWALLKSFDAGYDCIQVEVMPYDSDDGVVANVFVIKSDQAANEQKPTDRLPQERCIKIVASGMRYHGVDDEYIDYQVMNVPYIPNRKPEEYLQFPQPAKQKKLKKLSFEEYLKRSKTRPWFLIGNRVIEIGSHDPDSGFVRIVMARMVGKPDSTFILMQTFFDPDLPDCESPGLVTPLQQAWAENQMVDQFKEARVSAECVMVIKDTSFKKTTIMSKTVKLLRRKDNNKVSAEQMVKNIGCDGKSIDENGSSIDENQRVPAARTESSSS